MTLKSKTPLNGNQTYPMNQKVSCKQENSETFGEDIREKVSQNAVSDLITGLTLLGAALIIAVFFGYLSYNTRLENEYDSEHTFVKCWNTGNYVCTQDWFGGCARYEPQTRCQRFRKRGSPTFKEWKSLKD